MKQRPADPGQLGFAGLLAQAEADNEARRFEQEAGHLPDDYEQAIPFYRGLIEKHHAAMLAADIVEVRRLRAEAHRLALRLNKGEPGILAHENAPGYVLARETAAAPGAVPLWGQEGEFIIALGGTRYAEAPAWRVRVRIEMDGMFGIGGSSCHWPGFAAHAVDYDRPCFSETGYRSFLGIYAPPVLELTPDAFASEVIAAHVRRALKGRLAAIEPRYRELTP